MATFRNFYLKICLSSRDTHLSTKYPIPTSPRDFTITALTDFPESGKLNTYKDLLCDMEQWKDDKFCSPETQDFVPD